VIARAQGNPLFIEELSYGLLESGMAVVNSGTCTLPPNFVSADVPSSMEGLINSRMDLLPLSTQTLAKVGTFCHCFRVRYCQYDSLTRIAHHHHHYCCCCCCSCSIGDWLRVSTRNAAGHLCV